MGRPRKEPRHQVQTCAQVATDAPDVSPASSSDEGDDILGAARGVVSVPPTPVLHADGVSTAAADVAAACISKGGGGGGGTLLESDDSEREADGSDADGIDLAEQEVFKGNVKLFIELADNIATKTKEVSALKKQKSDARDAIMRFMKRYEVEQCVAESNKLYLASTKTSQPVNKTFITSFLTSSLGTEAAVRMVDMMWTSRQVTSKETLKRSRLNDRQLERIRSNT